MRDLKIKLQFPSKNTRCPLLRIRITKMAIRRQVLCLDIKIHHKTGHHMESSHISRDNSHNGQISSKDAYYCIGVEEGFPKFHPKNQRTKSQNKSSTLNTWPNSPVSPPLERRTENVFPLPDKFTRIWADNSTIE